MYGPIVNDAKASHASIFTAHARLCCFSFCILVVVVAAALGVLWLDDRISRFESQANTPTRSKPKDHIPPDIFLPLGDDALRRDS